MNTSLTEIGRYADDTANEIWKGITDRHENWEDEIELFELYSDALESGSYSPFHDVPVEVMYDLIEVRLLRLAQGRGPGKGIGDD